MIPIPTPTTDPINMADWLEARALVAADGNASVTELRRLLVSTGAASQHDGGDDPESDEYLAEQALEEIEDRARACDGAYPFTLDDRNVLEVRSEITACQAYLFCLLLSLAGAGRGEQENEL